MSNLVLFNYSYYVFYARSRSIQVTDNFICFDICISHISLFQYRRNKFPLNTAPKQCTYFHVQIYSLQLKIIINFNSLPITVSVNRLTFYRRKISLQLSFSFVHALKNTNQSPSRYSGMTDGKSF